MSAHPATEGPREAVVQLSDLGASNNESTESTTDLESFCTGGVEKGATTENLASDNHLMVQPSVTSPKEHSIGSETDVIGMRDTADNTFGEVGNQAQRRTWGSERAKRIADGRDQGQENSVEDGRNELYLDPTPNTPRLSSSPSPAPGNKRPIEQDGSPTSEIQSIMEQFKDGNGDEDDGGDGDSVMEGERNLNAPVEHPPQRSSLEPLRDPHFERGSAADPEAMIEISRVPNITPSSFGANNGEVFTPTRVSGLPQSTRFGNTNTYVIPSPHSSASLPKELPPAPDPEPDLPFDFHRFLEQLRHRTADPVAKYLRSFLTEFGKKQWMAHEQMKFISDFLIFIANKMALCEIWRGVSDAEFDNAKEGMEKLVMNRLYSQTFSPAIPAPTPMSSAIGKRKNTEKLLGPGRRGQHQEDVERDDILSQKVRIYGWVQERHLDIAPVGGNGRRLLNLAQQELLKIKTYRAPRDKIICVLNCCKVIFGLLRNSKSSDTSADSFVPLLIYVVLHANPEHLVSNVQYILRFRNQEKLEGEAGYYLSSLMGAIQFIENLDRTSLTVSDEEFEHSVETAVSAIAEPHQQPPSPPPRPRQSNHVQVSEKSSLSQPEVVPRNSIEAEYSTPGKSTSFHGRAEGPANRNGAEESTAVNGLLRTIQRPLAGLGKIFSEEAESGPRSERQMLAAPAQPPRRLSPDVFQPPRHSDDVERPDDGTRQSTLISDGHVGRAKAEDAAARQASAEASEAQRIQRAEHHNVVETLAGMFPDLDKDIIDDVVRMKQGRVGLAVDACLALNTS